MNQKLGKAQHDSSKINNHLICYDNISKLYYAKSKAPHCVFELTERDQKRMIPSTIHLSGIISSKYDGHSHNIFSYKSTKLGDYLQKTPHPPIKSGIKGRTSIKLVKMSQQYIAVIANKDELAKFLQIRL